MIATRQPTTLADFEAFVLRAANDADRYELITGEITDVPSNTFVSKIAIRIAMYIGLYLLQNDIGHVTGEGGGYIIDDNVFAPDVAFVSYARQPELPHKGFTPVAPNLAVEVISDPNNSAEQAVLRRKLVVYLAADTIVWVVDPFAQTVEVYTNGKTTQLLRADDTLGGGTVLPSFELPLTNIFPPAPQAPEDETGG